MLRQALVIEGHDLLRGQQAEGTLVTQLITRAQKMESVSYVSANNLPKDLFIAQRSLVWFTGHCTVYQAERRGMLEQRLTRGYAPILTHEAAADIPTDLLVLSACYTASEVFMKQKYNAKAVIGFAGEMQINIALTFAACFASAFMAEVRRDRVDVETITDCFAWTTEHVPHSGAVMWLGARR
jgi:hypothetical protein